MTTVTLGLSGAVGHDPAAAVFIDGELIAAIEEERLIRRKHAKGELPFHSARHCLQIAGLKPSDVNQIAIPYAPVSLFNKARWHYAYRHWYAPDRSVDSVLNGNRRYRRYRKELNQLLEKLQIRSDKVKIIPVEHQLAHASSCYHLNESSQKTAIFCNDSKGEYSNIFLGYGENGKIVRVKEFYNPDSLCGMYAALTDYLGFDTLDGEFKVMGIAAFGDPNKYDLSYLAHLKGNNFRVDNTLIGTVGLRRYKAKSKGHYFSQKLVDLLGPRRVGNLVDDPYVHYAAAVQKLYEDLAAQLVVHYLSDILQETGRLAIAGTGSMNIRLNQRLQSLPMVKELIVHPACSDSGTAIGAASYAIRESGVKTSAVKNMYLGPSYTTAQCIEACKANRDKPLWEVLENPFEKAAELLAEGHILAWFRGRMEFGARALGNRSILADPTQAEVTGKLNNQVKFREPWRPYSASVLESVADEFAETQTRDKYMCLSVTVSDAWRKKYPSIIHIDGTTRAQIVDSDSSPDFHKLLSCFQKKSGHGMLINATLNRPGEALVCSPEDAVSMFLGTDLDYLIMEDILVRRREEPETW
ncbi:MAG: carbamoyltransferase [SAR86 cluster bacterium]|uniref:Carbamoyltransferase n=1 Tax=SAR86 cluster bacterium TaxID=2030880 RepID=A0A2A5B302_9GAMM|nr:MAG: carbamoyltransferase [SAR86 cluster bacterium]